MFASSVMPLFMKSNITPEFTGAIFRLSSSVSNMMSPTFAYFAIYVGFMALYNKNDFTVRKCYKVIVQLICSSNSTFTTFATLSAP